VGSLHSREVDSLLCKQPRKQNRFEKRGERREEGGNAKFCKYISRVRFFKVRSHNRVPPGHLILSCMREIYAKD
jgi:hypothetical protein